MKKYSTEKEEKEKTERHNYTISVVCKINKICAGEIPEETQMKNQKNGK